MAGMYDPNDKPDIVLALHKASDANRKVCEQVMVAWAFTENDSLLEGRLEELNHSYYQLQAIITQLEQDVRDGKFEQDSPTV